jgi:hypothetical protein
VYLAETQRVTVEVLGKDRFNVLRIYCVDSTSTEQVLFEGRTRLVDDVQEEGEDALFASIPECFDQQVES